MGISLVIDDQFEANIVDYTVVEDSTPLGPLDSSGGVSELTVSVADIENPGVLVNTTVDIADTLNGQLRTTLNNVQGDLVQSTFSGTSAMQRLNSEIYCPPAMNVRLEDYFNSVFQAVGTTLPIYQDGTDELRLIAPGWTGVLWDKLKQICTMYNIEIAAVAEQIVVRKTRGRLAETSNIIEAKWGIDHSNLMTQITVVDYQASAHPTETRIYPPELGTGDVISADPGETVTATLETNFSLATITPPQYGPSTKYDNALISRFSVTNGKNKLVEAEQFYASGGSLTVEIDPLDDTSLLLTFKAPNLKNDGPFRLGQVDGAAGSTEFYSSIRITGTGVKFVPREHVVKTGVPENYVTQVQDKKLDNIFAYDAGKAFSLVRSALCDIATYNYTVQIETDYVNRLGETGLITAETYDEFNSASGTENYTEFNTDQGSKTYTEWQEEKKIGDAALFENQAFGNVAGARHEFRDSMFRIRSATITPDSISYSAEQDTTHADFADNWSDSTTYAEFNTAMGDLSYLEFGVKPLWRP